MMRHNQYAAGYSILSSLPNSPGQPTASSGTPIASRAARKISPKIVPSRQKSAGGT